MCLERALSGSVAGVAHGCSVYGPEDGVYNLAETFSRTKIAASQAPRNDSTFTLSKYHLCHTVEIATSQAPRNDSTFTLSK